LQQVDLTGEFPRKNKLQDVIEAVSSARKSGFDNLNLDLIYCLSEQTM